MGLLFVGIYVTHYVVTLLTGFALEGVGPDAPDYILCTEYLRGKDVSEHLKKIGRVQHVSIPLGTNLSFIVLNYWLWKKEENIIFGIPQMMEVGSNET